MKQPMVSVVIPCRNEQGRIERCLASIFEQQPFPGGFEVIVCDGMSDDGTRELLDDLASREPRLKVIDNPDRTTARAMNMGIRHARGKYIAIAGAHNHYAPDYLSASVQVLQETGADNVGGSMLCVGESPVQKAIACAHHSAFAAGGARWHNPDYEGPADTVFGGVYRREVFETIGLLDEELVRNQDDEFNLRLIRAGGKIWHSRRIKSWYAPRPSLKALFQQYAQYGYWKVRVIQKHKLPASIRHLVPGCFVFSLMALSAASLLWPSARWALLALAAAYLVSSLTASGLAAAKDGAELFLLLPLVFGTYHLAYGWGFLRGVWDFVILRRGPAPAFTQVTRTPARARS